jgi:carbamoyl-phosphate synthase large subunit
VLPFSRFPGADALLGPEMRATGEVMGIGPDFATAFAKAARAAGQPLPASRGDRQPAVAITVNDRDKPAATLLAQRFHDIGFRIYATGGTARAIRRLGTPVDEVAKVHAPGTVTIPDLILSGDVDLVVNTPLGRGARGDGYEIRRATTQARVPCITTLSGATAAVQAMARAWKVDPKPLQELHLGPHVDTRTPA